MAKVKCKECGGPTKGYKCDVCGEEFAVHDKKHKCGEVHCMPLCVKCGEAETNCKC